MLVLAAVVVVVAAVVVAEVVISCDCSFGGGAVAIGKTGGTTKQTTACFFCLGGLVCDCTKLCQVLSKPFRPKRQSKRTDLRGIFLPMCAICSASFSILRQPACHLLHLEDRPFHIAWYLQDFAHECK